MREFFGSLKFKIIVGILALFLGLMIYAATSSGMTITPSSLLGMVTAPFQKLASSVSGAVEAQLDKLLNADKYYQETQLLKEQMAELYKQFIDYEDIKDENEHLREVLGLKEENPDYEFSPPAFVIARESNDVYASFTIDIGSLDGIAQDDPVITSLGLVGRVVDVAPTYSRVATILSPEVPVGVYCVQTKDVGVLEGSIELAKAGKCRMLYIDKESKIKPGDLIVTAGQTGIFPDGIMIGTVDEVFIEESGLTLSAVITPAVDVSKVKNAFVITGFEGQGLGYE